MPDSGAGARPADAARQALRAAREQGRGGPEGADRRDPASTPPVGVARVRGAGRPGDVAREALRRAVESKAAGSEEPVGEGVPAEPTGIRAGEGAPPGAPLPSRSGARPGDIAREALRVARDAAERARTEAENAEDKEPKTARRAAGSPPPRSWARQGTPGGSPGRTGGHRARDVRELLAGAFELPSEGPAPDESTHDMASARPTSTEQPDTGGAPTPTHDLTSHASASEGPAPDASDGPTHASESHDPEALDPAPHGHPMPDHSTGAAAEVTPRVPRTMAAPSLPHSRLRSSGGTPIGELRRTFPAFPPRPSAEGEGGFAESWWGNAWVAALEEGALDAARLARGRAYADKGHVDAITVTPGLVLAYVHGSRPRPYRVQLRLRTLDDDEWDRFLDAAAERPAHIAALLDKKMPEALAGAGAGAGTGRGTGTPRAVRLLPGPGELDPRCSCPDFGHPCKHAAALCYQTARLLDEDPFVLLLLRGRGERELLDALSRRNAARAARPAQEQEPAPLPGVRARDALAPRTLPPLPVPLPPPPHPEQPPVYPGAPGGPDPFALDQLATDAAARAHALLTTGRDPVAELTLWQDAVRLAAARPGSGLTATTRALYSSLAAATGRTPADLARAVAAWRQGGLEGLAVLEEPWDPPAGRFDRARPLLLAADLPAFRPWRNHLTHPHGHVQLRLGRDGLWYAYESEPGHDDWWPRGTPDLDPVGALTGIGTTTDDL
ncbi:SWIM zinc finger family protein [Streptomyces tailanensis]|uniref:SWIM zinc finger family protein n=1 Tax=Streptomyces tailanensis TaxID=2569858 RepID=UPI00122E66A1|nr:SWIM zinc finger family protein [Streptomyces tailanensis]